MRNIFIAIIILLAGMTESSAADLRGKVFGYDISGKKTELMGAVVRWKDSKIGAKSAKNGEFKIARDAKHDVLTITFAGYMPFEEEIHSDNYIEVQMEINQTQTVEVVGRQSAVVLRESAMNTSEITHAGLRKAACCNLAESFVANPSVDVNYSDAVTGAKQIELLGLEGMYTQMMTDNIPNLRGLGATFGLNYVPGQWMQAIQISKGTASVTGGFESITGQINVDYKRPTQNKPLFVNLYAGSEERFEGDVLASIPLAEGFATNIFVHANKNSKEIDDNDDSFMDMPLEEQLTALNTWEYEGSGLHTLHTIKALNETRRAGQTGYFDGDKSRYGVQIKTERYELYGKAGYTFDTPLYNSLAAMYSLSSHNQNAFYGNNRYHGNQKSGYAKLVFETRWGMKPHVHAHNHADDEHEHEHFEDEEIHRLSVGGSFNFDQFDETYRGIGTDTAIAKIERMPGVFAEYTYLGLRNFTVIAGGRYDWHNLYGGFFTPRFHVRYAPVEEFSLRLSAGKGYHFNNIFAENSAILASSRAIHVLGSLDPEEAWNFGVNATVLFEMLGHKFTLNTDFYHTNFINQVVVDMERSANAVYFYNLDGDSYSNCYQADLSFAPVENLDVMLAYRYNDVKQTMDGHLTEKPLQSRYKAFVNLAYRAPWGIKLDFTTVLNGGGKLPNTDAYPEKYRLESDFHSFVTMQAQITKTLGDFEIYLGGENLTNYKQDMPILGAEAPFGDFFDTSIIYAPIMGAKFYAGIRWNVL